MGWLDYLFIAIVVLSVLFGALRGFIREALSLLTWILAFVLALGYGPSFADRLKNVIDYVPVRVVVADIIVFFLVLLAGAVLTRLVGLLIRGSGLAPVDRLLGSGFGLLRGAFIVLALVMLAGLGTLGEESWWKQSALVPHLKPLADDLRGLIPPQWLAYLQPPVPAAKAPAKQVEK
jgi:membrane protein required for colicin V production